MESGRVDALWQGIYDYMRRVVQFNIFYFKPECSQGNNPDGKRQAFSVSVKKQESENKACKCLSGLLRRRFTNG